MAMVKKNFSPLLLATAFGVVIGLMLAYLFSFSHEHERVTQGTIQSETKTDIIVPPPSEPFLPLKIQMLRENSNLPLLREEKSTEIPAQCTALIEKYTAGNRSASSRKMKSRGDIPELLNQLGLLGEAVEVGVREGDLSQWILSHWRGRKYHLVDPWLEQDQKIYQDISNVRQPTTLPPVLTSYSSPGCAD
jgi:hypothetical protein